MQLRRCPTNICLCSLPQVMQPSRLFKWPLQQKTVCNKHSFCRRQLHLPSTACTYKTHCRLTSTRISFEECNEETGLSKKYQNKHQIFTPHFPHETPAALRHSLLHPEQPCTLNLLLLLWGLASLLPPIWQILSHTAQQNQVGTEEQHRDTIYNIYTYMSIWYMLTFPYPCK